MLSKVLWAGYSMRMRRLGDTVAEIAASKHFLKPRKGLRCGRSAAYVCDSGVDLGFWGIAPGAFARGVGKKG